jgi:predicted nucleic acid-binding protein
VTVVVDASVAVKWVSVEEGSDAAARLQLSEPLASPDFLIVECANALRIKARPQEISPQEAQAGLAAIQATPIRLFSSSNYASEAQRLAFELDHPVYDCLYLAVALVWKFVLVTADRRFVANVASRGNHARAVRLLEAA